MLMIIGISRFSLRFAFKTAPDSAVRLVIYWDVESAARSVVVSAGDSVDQLGSQHASIIMGTEHAAISCSLAYIFSKSPVSQISCFFSKIGSF